MAHYTIRCNLVSATFPFYTENWGHSVIVPTYDFNYDRQAASTISDYDKDKGIPQVYYTHNCMPTNQGFQSIGYRKIWEPYSGAVTDFDRAFPIITPTKNRFIFVPAGGKNYIADAVVGAWASVNPLPVGTVPDNVQVTIALVQGQTYVCYANYGIFVYDDVAKTFLPQTVTGLAIENVKAICSANGYMIAVTNEEVAWSSLLDPLDFEPNLETGAGGGFLSEAQGTITFCVPISGGFLVHCAKNIVSATYSGNIQYPFTFRQIHNSAGSASPELTSWQAFAAEHYAWNVNGLQKINRVDAGLVFPDLNAFLSGKVYEDFDETTEIFTTTYLTDPLDLHVVYNSARYLIISYGITTGFYTYAIVYDALLKRFGKLKIDHVDCFEWNFPNLFGELSYDDLSATSYDALGATTYDELGTRIERPQVTGETLAFLQMDGTVKLVTFDVGNSAANGVLLAGKYQLQRNNFIIHLNSEIETVIAGQTFSYKILPSLDGKTLLPAVAPMLTKTSPRLRQYGRRVTAQNFSSLFTGAFNLVSFQITIAPGPVR